MLISENGSSSSFCFYLPSYSSGVRNVAAQKRSQLALYCTVDKEDNQPISLIPPCVLKLESFRFILDSQQNP